jgi:DNA polymerase-3 subunit delta'
MSLIYSWQENGYQRLLQAKQQQRLPHGLLLTAKEGSGLAEFCRSWSQYMLCTSTGDSPCHQCKSCQLFESESHPDFYWIGLLEDKKQITIDQIRHLSMQLQETPSLSGWRVAVIYQAERLNVSAFNALLKTLEEPGADTLLILAANDRSSIPPTIISRCQHLSLDPARHAKLLDWLSIECPQSPAESLELALKLAHGAPLAAARLIKEGELAFFEEVADLLTGVLEQRALPTSIAEYDKVAPEMLLSWWEFLVSAMIRHHKTGTAVSTKCMQNVYKLAERADIGLLFAFRDNILFQLKELKEGISLNIKMQLDQLAIEWQKCHRSATTQHPI